MSLADWVRLNPNHCGSDIALLVLETEKKPMTVSRIVTRAHAAGSKMTVQGIASGLRSLARNGLVVRVRVPGRTDFMNAASWTRTCEPIDKWFRWKESAKR